jgi:hypothetical protein
LRRQQLWLGDLIQPSEKPTQALLDCVSVRLHVGIQTRRRRLPKQTKKRETKKKTKSRQLRNTGSSTSLSKTSSVRSLERIFENKCPRNAHQSHFQYSSFSDANDSNMVIWTSLKKLNKQTNKQTQCRARNNGTRTQAGTRLLQQVRKTRQETGIHRMICDGPAAAGREMFCHCCAARSTTAL